MTRLPSNEIQHLNVTKACFVHYDKSHLIKAMDEISSMLPMLGKIPLFEDLNALDHAAIIEKITLNYYPSDYVIFKKGDEADALYIIKSGGVVVFDTNESGEKVEIAKLGMFDFFGEMALFDSALRNASVQTTQDCELLKLGKKEFMELVARNAHVAKILTASYVSRLAHNKK